MPLMAEAELPFKQPSLSRSRVLTEDDAGDLTNSNFS